MSSSGASPRSSFLFVAVLVLGSGIAACGNDSSRRKTPVTCAITDLCPRQGSQTGGEIVVIEGTGFADPPTVSFGSIPSGPVTFVSAQEITAEAPPVTAGGVVDITVDLPTGGTCTMAGAYTFRTVDPMVDQWEPNDDPGTCENVPPHLAVLFNPTIDSIADEDWFCFSTIILGDRTISLLLSGAPIDLDLEIYDSGGSFLMGSYNGAGVDEILVAPGGDTYSARVIGPCGEVGSYEITFSG